MSFVLNSKLQARSYITKVFNCLLFANSIFTYGYNKFQTNGRQSTVSVPTKTCFHGVPEWCGRTLHYEAAYAVTSMDIFQLVEIIPIDFYLLCPLKNNLQIVSDIKLYS